jgi:LmbE family N-acetylglucosaminyl deacetylase
MLLLLALSVPPSALQAQVPVTNSSADIYMQLKKLNVLGSVLYIAAHPDDENNGFLPYLAKEKMYRTGYLSLTRGDGGQNLIGSEQGIELGLIRTQELLAARRVDGAEQYFTRAYEFGFSKSWQEALRIWDREKVLSDVVWMIRKFQPDIIIARFPGDTRAGHGHHAASSVLAQEAYTAAADPKRFPEQFNYGVKPWLAKRILWNTFNFGGTNTTANDQLKVEVGGYNSLIGKSYGELGGEARTMHKSQGEGRPRRRGQVYEYFSTFAGDPPKNDLMDGIVIDWKRINGGEKIETQINTIISNFQFEKPETSVPALVNVYRLIKALPAGNWRDKKLAETQNIIEACTALFSEATTSQENVVQGDVLNVSFFFNKRKESNVTVKSVKLENFDTTVNAALGVNNNFTFNRTHPVSADKKISQPYWLEYPKEEGQFVVKDQLLIGKAENDPSFEAIYTVAIEGEDFTIKRPVQYKVVDPAKGELYQPLAVLPRVELNFTKENFISLNGQTVNVQGQFKKNGNSKDGLESKFAVAPGWDYDAKSQMTTRVSGGNNYMIIPKDKQSNTKTEIAISSGTPGVYLGNTKVIAYDHIPTITYFTQAKANLLNLNIKIEGRKIGYIVGAGDKVPQALEQLGYEVKILNEADLTEENLKQFDAVITGIRASNIFEFLTAKNDVLIKYVENGGNLIAQYIKSNTTSTNKPLKIGPYPFSISAGSRVTEEDAKVKFVLPDHTVLNYPNKITEKDFDGWIQERSTYQVSQSDSHFEMPLAMNDTGEKESNGSLAIAKYGKGNFAYVSLVLFRELPAGVPGAYRILANLIAMPKNK